MTENTNQNPPGINANRQKKKIIQSDPVNLLATFVCLEALLVLAGAIYFLNRIFVEVPANLPGAIVIFTITLLIASGLMVTSIATFKGKSWTRGAIVTWQILQFAVASSFIQGIEEWQFVGWVLIFSALLCTLLTVVVTLKSNELEKRKR